MENKRPSEGAAVEQAESDLQATVGRVGPRWIDALTEVPRATVEAMSLGVSWLPLVATAQRGEPHHVFVLPGFMGGDRSTRPLREFLRRLNYDARPWEQGVNRGDLQQFERTVELFSKLYAQTQQPISLVGQSLGGVYARQIAAVLPQAVRCVVTLGSPYQAMSSSAANRVVARLFREISGQTIERARERVPLAAPLEVPATSIYSRMDGIVGWQNCIEPESALSENIHIYASHAGMAVNPIILNLIADRLAQDPEAWCKYNERLDLKSSSQRPASQKRA